MFGIAALNLLRGGRSLPKLNIGERPIANKYREGKMKRTLKRGLKAFEIVNREANRTGDFVFGHHQSLLVLNAACLSCNTPAGGEE